MNKGQIISVDLIVSITIFVSIFAIALLVSNRAIDQLKTSYEISLMSKRIQRISDVLVRTTGLPEDWNETNVISVGLAETENVLNYTKILRLKNMDDNKIRALLGLEEYNFFLNFTNITRGFFPEGSIFLGMKPTNAKIVIPIERFVLIDFGNRREMGIMEFVLWR